ncbi:Uridine-cytidine kinase [Apis mellifera carnica]|nr:Uridine-cytidine kinase [Apis mellifera carnica]
MAAKMQHFDPPSSASSESDDEVCLGEKEIFLVDELCEDAEHYRRSDIGTPTPQSPRPPSTGKPTYCQESRMSGFEHIRYESKTKLPLIYFLRLVKMCDMKVFVDTDADRGFKLREKLAHSYIGQPLPSSLYLLPDTPQIKGLHTFIRNKETYRDEFIFYSKRLIRLVIEYALSLLPFEDVTVETPQGVLYNGKRAATDKICGVSILRAGETMEQAVRDVCKDIRIGKILIQTNQQTGEPELYYLRLPKDIKDYKVILMDATVATGAAAIMAIRVLLDHDVAEENVLLVSLLMAESGVHSIAYAFPRVKIVTSALDPVINEKFYVLPGIGNFGDRYFGTEPSSIDD